MAEPIGGSSPAEVAVNYGLPGLVEELQKNTLWGGRWERIFDQASNAGVPNVRVAEATINASAGTERPDDPTFPFRFTARLLGRVSEPSETDVQRQLLVRRDAKRLETLKTSLEQQVRAPRMGASVADIQSRLIAQIDGADRALSLLNNIFPEYLSENR